MANNTELQLSNSIKSNKNELLKFRNSSKDLKNMNQQSLVNALLMLYLIYINLIFQLIL